jgi:hypothetical protein
MDPFWTRNRVIAAVVAALVVVVAAVVLLVVAGDDDTEVATDDTTTTTEATTTTTEAATTTTTTEAPEPDDELTREELGQAVWPHVESDTRYDDPTAAARGFAVELAGFTDPLVGDFAQGDSRSGEVEVRSSPRGAVTTVLVRQLGAESTWWVIGAATENIEVDDPQSGSAIDDPLQLSGRARAFEGTVQVAVFADGDTEPLGEGFVTGSGGEELGPFSDSIPFRSPGGGW